MRVSTPQRTANLMIATIIQEDSMQPPSKETTFELPMVSQLVPQIRPLTNSSTDSDYAKYEMEISMSVLDAENQI